MESPAPRAPFAAPGATPHPASAGRLRAKLPEILLEMASVVLAVLLAFAVDEWRDARAKRELADRARQSVIAELRANREELRGTYGANAKRLQAMQRTLDLLAAHPEARDVQVELGFVAAQLSDAAWDTTRTTQAVQWLPFDWVVAIARVYETQSVYKTAQLDMLQRTRAAVAEFATTKRPPEIVAPLRSQLETFQSLGGQLASEYDRALSPRPAKH